jgi:hypothetical protein
MKSQAYKPASKLGQKEGQQILKNFKPLFNGPTTKTHLHQ